jgi:putative hydrolase
MIACDMHIHSIRSTCGFHTLLEIVSIMRGKGQKGFALTDHSPALGTPRSHFSVMLRRMPAVIEGVRVFKGVESSVMNVAGDIDIALFEGTRYEVILAGLHPHDLFTVSQGIGENTRALVNAMKRNPEIRCITHPNYTTLPVDLDMLTDAAAANNVALEINNSHLRNSKANRETIPRLLELVIEKGAPVMVNSDGHMFQEMGEYEEALAFLAPYGIDRFRVVNRTLESTLEFLGLEK